MAEDPNRSDALADGFAQWTEGWRKIAEFSSEMNEAWSKSMLPFIMARAAEKRTGLGNELGDAIERLAQGPRLADMWDIDRKLMSAFAAWTAMRQKLAAYNANTSRPWMRALERYKQLAFQSIPGGVMVEFIDSETTDSAIGKKDV